MIIAIDTNILLDILKEDPSHFEHSKNLLQEYHSQGSLIICPIVYSEVLTFFLEKFDQQEATANLQQFLLDFDIQVINFTLEDAQKTASTWRNALRSNKQKIVCPKCGTSNQPLCIQCKETLLWRNHIITDFYIGAHAENRAEFLLTRDQGFYSKYCNIKIRSK